MSPRTRAALVVTLLLAGAVLAAQQPSPAPAGAAAAKAARSFPDAASHRAAFLKLIDRPRVPAAPELRSLPDDEGLAVQHLAFAVEAGERATALVVASRTPGRRPAIVYLHGTGGSKDRSLPRLKELAQRGFVAVGLDGRYHGERRGGSDTEGDPYSDAIIAAFRTGQGHPFLFDSVWDVMRLLDYLETRDDVDPSRLGLTGFSKGGMETYLTAAVDTRVAAAVAKHGVQSFRWGLEHGAWDSRAWSLRTAVEGAAAEARQPINPAFLRTLYDRVAPGLYGEFDGPAMVPLAAPRPFLIVSGDSDPRTPQAGVRETARAAQAAYEAAKVADRFEHRVLPDTGHEETPSGNLATVEWFVRWLKP